MWFKTKTPALGDFEQLVLFGVLRLELEDSAYGAALRQEIHARSGRDVSINAVYTTLDRLESKGLLKSRVGDPALQRIRALPGVEAAGTIDDLPLIEGSSQTLDLEGYPPQRDPVGAKWTNFGPPFWTTF